MDEAALLARINREEAEDAEAVDGSAADDLPQTLMELSVALFPSPGFNSTTQILNEWRTRTGRTFLQPSLLRTSSTHNLLSVFAQPSRMCRWRCGRPRVSEWRSR